MKKRIILISVINAVFITLFIILFFVNKAAVSGVLSQNLYERWSSDETVYTQISLFLSSKDGLVKNDIYMNRSIIEQKMSENSIKQKVITLPNGKTLDSGKFWIDAYSGLGGSMDIMYENKSATADVLVTGGEFFQFHPMSFLYGNRYSDDELMLDRVIIDDQLAWQLFGSSDVNGMRIQINGMDFLVAGVVDSSSYSISELVKGKSPMLFMPYDTAFMLNEDIKITCYEVCIPEPLNGVGFNIFKEAVQASENGILTVNKTRFGLENILKIISERNISRIRIEEIALPYWENEARIIENKSAFLVSFMIFCLIFPVATVILIFIILIRKRKKLYEKIKSIAISTYQKLSSRIKSKFAAQKNN